MENYLERDTGSSHQAILCNLQHPNPEFIKATLEAFPDAGVATVEQALVLYLEGGYKFLDVRSDREKDFGAIKNSIHVPYTKDKKEFLPEGMKITKTRLDKEAWLKAVNSKVPKKDTKLIVHDMIGKTYGLECLELLFDNGYENIVGLRGGFKPWFKTFDFNLRRRNFGEYQENYAGHDQLAAGDSCGIHASGAGFQNQDRLSGDFWDQFDRIV